MPFQFQHMPVQQRQQLPSDDSFGILAKGGTQEGVLVLADAMLLSQLENPQRWGLSQHHGHALDRLSKIPPQSAPCDGLDPASQESAVEHRGISPVFFPEAMQQRRCGFIGEFFKSERIGLNR